MCALLPSRHLSPDPHFQKWGSKLTPEAFDCFQFLKSLIDTSHKTYTANWFKKFVLNEFLENQYSIKIFDHVPFRMKNHNQNCVIITRMF